MSEHRPVIRSRRCTRHRGDHGLESAALARRCGTSRRVLLGHRRSATWAELGCARSHAPHRQRGGCARLSVGGHPPQRCVAGSLATPLQCADLHGRRSSPRRDGVLGMALPGRGPSETRFHRPRAPETAKDVTADRARHAGTEQGLPRSAASMKPSMARPRTRSVCAMVIILSAKRLPAALWHPNEFFRHSTAGRSRRSARLFVSGSPRRGRTSRGRGTSQGGPCSVSTPFFAPRRTSQ